MLEIQALAITQFDRRYKSTTKLVNIVIRQAKEE